ncbi:MAG: septum formation protein Maf [Rhodospirillaceae bacterium]|nr:septum formation protein Maf [Rhodospirillaceae bacterium]
MNPARPLILASASKSRSALLRAAGVAFDVIPPQTDEDSVKAVLKAKGASAADCAETLAELKAVQISKQYDHALVIGADQMLECEGAWFDKPADMDGARQHLLALRGKTHVLPTAVAVVLNGARLWHHVALPRLTMRGFSDAFIDSYLKTAGPKVLTSVGAYQLEGPGAQLFSRIEGDFFTILGLPLLELLAYLRAHEVVEQ